MLALFGANFAAVVSARGWFCRFTSRTFAVIATAGLLSACMPATVPLVGRDPADPAAKVAGVGYRSTIAPYASLRPSTPAPWQERNENVTPQPKQDH